MDPFSITVGAITLAGATKTAIGGILRLKALRDAPEELHDLLAELSQFEEVLQAIQDTVHPSESTGSTLEILLGEAKDKIVEFDSLIEYRLTQAGTSSKVDRLRWIESHKDVDRLREQLKDIRANLDVIIGARTSTTVQHTLELMRQLHSENQELRQMTAALACLPKILEEVQSNGSAVTGFLSNFPHLTLQSSRSDLRSVPDNTVAQTNRNDVYARSRDQLQLQRTYNAGHCRSDCSCQCHCTSFSWTPWSLARLFGRAHLGKKGPSLVGASRHISSCKASAISQIQVMYIVPTWFATKAIYIRYTSSPLHCPEWLIRTPRLVDNEKNRGFIAVYEGDLPMFKSAIASGECTPNDIDLLGRSLIYAVIILQRYNILAHLVGMGVDVLQPISMPIGWLDTLWYVMTGYCFSTVNPTTREALPLQDLVPDYPWDEYKKKFGFTLLHEIVCRISGRDLDNAIQIHSAEVNRLNHAGRSPLEMAIRHENIAAIRTLLERGADPHIGNGMPICEAFDVKTRERLVIIELLLRSGVPIHRSARDNIAGHWIEIVSWEDSPESSMIDRLLIEHGIDVNHQAHGETLLTILFLWSCNEASTERIKQLIGLGAHLDVKTNEGNTIAHLAVIFSTSSDLAKALSVIDLGRLDLDLKNQDGHTAFDLLRKRNGLKWENYYKKSWQSRGYWTFDKEPRYTKNKYQVILVLEALLHHIQDSQGIPKDQQYPPLGEYLSDDKDEEPVPGAWPV